MEPATIPLRITRFRSLPIILGPRGFRTTLAGVGEICGHGGQSGHGAQDVETAAAVVVDVVETVIQI